jgi:hypothetical protein
MIEFTIKRTYQLDRTEGVLCGIGGAPLYQTIELPWKANKRNVSCIPEGSYVCKRYIRTNGQVCWELHNVIKRDDILIHIANTVRDLKGCIGIGGRKGWVKKLGWVNALFGVLDSTIAFKSFMKLTDPEPVIVLTITSDKRG